MSGRLTSPKGDADLQGRETGIIVSLKNSTTLKGEKNEKNYSTSYRIGHGFSYDI